MEAIAEAFRVGGIWMYLILLLCLIVYPVFLGATGLFGFGLFSDSGKRKLTLIAAGLSTVGGLALLVVGVVGWQVGLMDMRAAMEVASPENRARMRAMGEEMAANPLIFGGGASVLPGLGGLVYLAVGLMFGGGDDS